MAEPTPAHIYEIAKSAAVIHFRANVVDPTAADVLADRLAAGLAAGYARAAAEQRKAWLSLGDDALRAAAVQVANLGLNPDPGAGEIYIYPRGGALIVGPTPGAVRAMLRRAGYEIEVFLCGHHDADGIDVRAGRVVGFEPGRAPLDWIATPATCIGARVLVVDTNTGESVLDRWAPTAIIERHRGGKSGPWSSQWDEMAIKTMQLRAMKYMPKDRLSASVVDAVRAEVDYIDAAFEEVQQQPARRTVTMAAPAITAPAQLPESRQLAAPPLEVPAQRPADPIPATTQPAQAQTTRAAPTWPAALRAEIAALAVAMGRAAPTTIGTARALLADAGITAPDTMEPTALATLLAEAAVNAAEREPSPAR